ncbi:MAG: phosphoribosylglycinamide formyltransferase [Opitutales bacterium]|nr:phosphoribosylglycinamide formyltransferase [Opitutales bacterium]
MKKLNCAVIGSTRGSTLIPVLEAASEGKVNAELALVVSNRRESGILQKARDAGIRDVWCPLNGRDRKSYDRELTNILRDHEIDFILLMGYMRILSAEFVNDWNGRIFNVHPSLLPKHGGLMDLDVHRAAISSGDKESGCTIHIVTEEVDGGPIVVQKKTPIFKEDTPESLKERVQKLEAEAFLEILQNPKAHIIT